MPRRLEGKGAITEVSGKLVTVGEVGNAASLEFEVVVAEGVGAVSLLSGRKDMFEFEGDWWGGRSRIIGAALVPIGACLVEPGAEPFLQVEVVSAVEASGVEVLVLLARAEVGIGSLEAPNEPEKGGLPPLATEGVALEKR